MRKRTQKKLKILQIVLSVCFVVSLCFGIVSLDNSKQKVYGESNYLDLSTAIVKQWGNWQINGTSMAVDNSAYGDMFAMTDIYVGDNQDLVFAADVKTTSQYLSIVFGANKYDDPGNGWYAIQVGEIGIVKLFSANKGTIGNHDNLRATWLTEEQKAKDSVRVKVEAFANGRIVCYVDDVMFTDTYDSGYNGGYLGFLTWFGVGTISNVEYSISDSKQTTFEIDELSAYDNYNYRNNTWGNWAFSENEIVATNAVYGDVFTISNLKPTKEQNVVYTADVKRSGGAAGLVFGVQNNNDPSGGGWYGYYVNSTEVRLFAVNTGSIGADPMQHRYDLTEEQKSAEYVNLKIEYNAETKEISTFIDGELKEVIKDEAYNGGHLSLFTSFADATFKNVKVQIKDLVEIEYLDLSSAIVRQWGDWKINGTSMVANNATYGDMFAMTDIYVGDNQDLVFAADVKSTNQIITLVFGANKYDDPGNGWYSLMVGATGEVKLYSANKGTIGNYADLRRTWLTQEQLAKESVRLKVEAFASGRIVCYVDDVMFVDTYDSGYNGGYLGFSTWLGAGTISNVEYSISDSTQTTFEIEELTSYDNYNYRNNTWGNWAFSENEIVATNAVYGDMFTISNLKPTKEQNVVYTADVKRSGAAGLVFGVQNNNDPSGGGWYGYYVNGTEARLFAVNTGSIGANPMQHRYDLTEEQKSAEYVNLKVEYDAANRLLMTYIDGQLKEKIYEPAYNGGHLALFTSFADATFKNVKVSIFDAKVGSLEFAELTDYEVLTYQSNYYWGDYSFTNDTVSVQNLPYGDNFAMSNIKQEKNQTLVFSADIYVEGLSAGLTFGVTNLAHPYEEGWYAITVNKGDKFSRYFSVNKGTALSGKKQMMTVGATASGYDNVKVVARANGLLSFYINGELMDHYYDEKYNGGYIGFNSCFSNAIFKNIKLQLVDDIAVVNGFTSNIAGLEYSKGKSVYEYEVSSNTQTATISVDVPEGYELYINGEQTAEYTIDIKDGKNLVDILTKNIETGKVGYMNILLKRYYNEQYRPGIHYTTKENWINDPNGLMYDRETGIYHAFYQWSADPNDNGNRDWYHIVSKDLINWEEKGIAFGSLPEGVSGSGSGIIDENNTSGLFNDSVAPGSRMVCMVTYHSAHPTVGLVYSLDEGETWILYKSNVIANENLVYGDHFRDPKVIWYEDDSYANGGIWLMIIGGWAPVRLFTSENLIDWTYNSTVIDYYGNVLSSECPDLFPLPVDGDENNIKWVLTTAGTSYIVGDLVKENGVFVFNTLAPSYKIFNSPILWTNLGDMYATQSFYNDKFNRRILISWMVDRTENLIENKTWNGTESLPHVVELKQIRGMYALNVYPVAEINANRYEQKQTEIKDKQLAEGETITVNSILDNLYDLETVIDVGTAEKIVLTVAKGDNCKTVITYDPVNYTLTLDTTKSGKVTNYVLKTCVVPENGKITLRTILDRSVIELFANNGQQAMMGLIFPDEGATEITLACEGGSCVVNSFDIWRLKSMYEVNAK